ncbi:MAG: hypothetical protein RIR00_1189, partial [Pseudomonadota bacterium]
PAVLGQYQQAGGVDVQPPGGRDALQMHRLEARPCGFGPLALGIDQADRRLAARFRLPGNVADRLVQQDRDLPRLGVLGQFRQRDHRIRRRPRPQLAHPLSIDEHQPLFDEGVGFAAGAEATFGHQLGDADTGVALGIGRFQRRGIAGGGLVRRLLRSRSRLDMAGLAAVFATVFAAVFSGRRTGVGTRRPAFAETARFAEIAGVPGLPFLAVAALGARTGAEIAPLALAFPVGAVSGTAFLTTGISVIPRFAFIAALKSAFAVAAFCKIAALAGTGTGRIAALAETAALGTVAALVTPFTTEGFPTLVAPIIPAIAPFATTPLFAEIRPGATAFATRSIVIAKAGTGAVLGPRRLAKTRPIFAFRTIPARTEGTAFTFRAIPTRTKGATFTFRTIPTRAEGTTFALRTIPARAEGAAFAFRAITARTKGATFAFRTIPTRAEGAAFAFRAIPARAEGTTFTLRTIPARTEGAAFAFRTIPARAEGLAFAFRTIPARAEGTAFAFRTITTRTEGAAFAFRTIPARAEGLAFALRPAIRAGTGLFPGRFGRAESRLAAAFPGRRRLGLVFGGTHPRAQGTVGITADGLVGSRPGVAQAQGLAGGVVTHVQRTASSSTSKTSVAFGGITPPAPRAP